MNITHTQVLANQGNSNLVELTFDEGGFTQDDGNVVHSVRLAVPHDEDQTEFIVHWLDQENERVDRGGVDVAPVPISVKQMDAARETRAARLAAEEAERAAEEIEQVETPQEP